MIFFSSKRYSNQQEIFVKMQKVLNKTDLFYFLGKELKIKTVSPFVSCFKMVEMWARGSESLPTWTFIYALRQYEYYKNQKSSSFLKYICRHFWRFKFRYLQIKYNLFIEPNVVESGLTLMHPGYRKIPSFCVIGENCTILPMVLCGKKRPGIEGKIIIGKNCYISTGVTILGPVNIGDNVTIGAGAVITKDIPDNVTVAGVPTHII